MSNATIGATGAAVVLSLTLLSAQSSQPTPPVTSTAPQHVQTISGCVVRDAANGGHATISDHGTSYRLAGKRDTEFDRYLGKKLEVRGTADASATTARATSGTPVPPDQTATAGQSDVPATETPRDNTSAGSIPLKTDKGTTADRTTRFQVKSVRVVSQSCL